MISSDRTIYFAKENLDMLLRELVKEFCRLNRKDVPAELVMIGGVAVQAMVSECKIVCVLKKY